MKACVFDFDGVLVDSEPLHYASLRDALAEREVLIDEDEYRQTLLAYDDWGAIRIALEARGLPAELEQVERTAERKARIFEAMIPSIGLFPGARELVLSLARELPLAIASGARRDEIEAILAGAGLRQAFRVVVGADDVPRTKPDPEPYLEACRRLAPHADGLRPEDCMAFEDSVAGILSARNAGMRVVGVCNSYERDALRLAHHVVDSLAELTPERLRAWFAEQPRRS